MAALGFCGEVTAKDECVSLRLHFLSVLALYDLTRLIHHLRMYLGQCSELEILTTSETEKKQDTHARTRSPSNGWDEGMALVDLRPGVYLLLMNTASC